MNQPAFQNLLAGFFRVKGSVNAQALSGIGHCRYLGVDVVLYYDEKVDPLNIHCYADLGTVAPARQREVFRALLLRNPSFRPEHSAVLGLDVATGRIVLVARITFQDALDGRRLAAILAHWIRNVFVLRSPQPKPTVRFGPGRARTLRWLS